MAASLRPGHPGAGDIASLMQLVERLLEQAMGDLAEVEQPLAQLAVQRCWSHLAASFEQIEAARLGGAAGRRASLLAAGDALAAARGALELIRRRGAVLPPAVRALTAGCEVVRRRLQEALGPPLGSDFD